LEPTPWIAALRRSHDALRASVEPLDETRLRRQSYASEWSIAQVLSHLGSGAEIFGLFLDAGLRGTEPPGRETFAPIWQAWNDRSPQSQATDALAADDALIKRLESLGPDELGTLRVPLFGRDLDATGLARLRLGEHAVHTWDVAVALDSSATVAADAVSLLIDGLGPVAARSGKPAEEPFTVRVSTTEPAREFIIQAGAEVRLEPAQAAGNPQHSDEDAPRGDHDAPRGDHDAPRGEPARLRLPAEAFVRLVYGRLDPAHTPAVEAAGVDLDDLRRTFPGF
jgi:uncharacterized protein (TIGR03083 family)